LFLEFLTQSHNTHDGNYFFQQSVSIVSPLDVQNCPVGATQAIHQLQDWIPGFFYMFTLWYLLAIQNSFLLPTKYLPLKCRKVYHLDHKVLAFCLVNSKSV